MYKQLIAFKGFKDMPLSDICSLFEHSRLLTDIAERKLALRDEKIKHLIADTIVPYPRDKTLDEVLPVGDPMRDILFNAYLSSLKQLDVKGLEEISKRMKETSLVSLEAMYYYVISLLVKEKAKLCNMTDLFIKHTLRKDNIFNWQEDAILFADTVILPSIPMGEYYIEPKELRLYSRTDTFNCI